MKAKNAPTVKTARKRLTAAKKKVRAAATEFNRADKSYDRAVAASKAADTKCRQRTRAKKNQCGRK